jgi:ABC-2 type transport system permease protein
VSSLRAVHAVWRRDLQITLRAPIVYVIGGLFLAVQGIAFAGLVSALSDPRRPAPLGALLEGQLAGTLLTWVLQLVVLTLLGMRTIADDKRSGAWELLLTAQVSERAAVVGKWLAAVTIYALLWLPTLAYLVIVEVYRVDAGGWDLASIACGYLGAIALGAALLAWAVAASAATSTTLVAGAFAFALLMALFLVGELPAAFPSIAVEHPVLASVLRVVSLRSVLVSFARGELSLAGIGFTAGLAVTGLSLAIAFACAGRRRRREVRVRFASTAVLGMCAGLVTALLVQRPVTIDVSANRRNSLDPATRAVLGALPGPARLTIVEPTLAALEPIYAEVRRVADRMAEHGRMRVTQVDPATIPGGLEQAARLAGVAPGDLASNGGVIVELGDRQRVVDRIQLVAIARDAAGTAAVERLAIEQAIAGALAQLSAAVPVTACVTSGHDELPIEAAPDDADWKLVADRLTGEGIELHVVPPDELARAIPDRCDVLIVAGPATPLGAEAALAIQRFVGGGRGLIVAAASRPISGLEGPGTSLAPTGLEAVLAAHDLGLPPAIAVDPSLAVREIRGALFVVDGYAPHPINAGFAQTRATLWFQPRVVVAGATATPLVQASAASWGERDLVQGPPEKDLDDLAGPVVLAAIKGRVLAVGSAESFTTAVLRGSASAGDLWLASAIRHVAGKPAPEVEVAARAPDQVRLVMTAGQRRLVMMLSIAGIPLVWIVAGALVLLLRRRRVS